ncbi:MAG TPA: TetR/AcrR family transcriptional regulator [Bacillota bacterium]|jgi:AcrR family transcriptional regulator|nr:TetR/AcrR family transcriptional regulator [Bacillota bacterium]HOL10552.1 TetR/AcrR family transcriptional regulator [Bacillota bacterium]HPO98256.1 TetR/AcrR family transcriptional regulator [Bacillota bacterium]
MKKNEILNKALELFANQGYFGTSMDDIAKAVGIKKASLYSHYSGKESIFTAVFDNILADYSLFINNLTAYNENIGCQEKLTAIFAGYIKNCQNNVKMAFWDRYYYYPPEYLKEYIQKMTYEIEMLLIEKITAIIELGIKNREIIDREAHDLALSFYYMMIGFSMAIKFYDEQDIDKDIAKCITVFLDGIRIKT